MEFVKSNEEDLDNMLSQDAIPSAELAKFSKGMIDVVPDAMFSKKEKEDLKKRTDEQMSDLRKKK